VAASLAVQLERRAVATGFLTNGSGKGKSTPFLPVTRSAGQLAGILETLARLQPEAEGEIGQLINGGIALPFGLSCIYFGLEDGFPARMALESLHRRRIPAVSRFARTRPGRREASLAAAGHGGGREDFPQEARG
jgi:hypothetical protein